MSKIKIAIFAFAYYLGVIRIFYWLNRNRILVLTYHNVIPDRLFDGTPHLGMSHRQSTFHAQMELVKRRFENSLWPAAPGRCVITFDDGYRNQWYVAGLILASLGLNAIYFVPFSPLEDGRPLTIDRVLQWVSYCPAGTYSVMDMTIVLADDTRRDAFSQIYGSLLLAPGKWDTICAELDACFSFDRLQTPKELEAMRFVPLNVMELLDIRRAGHQIGCHSWEHLPLASLPTDRMTLDFERCTKRRMELDIKLYSYPFGSTLDEVSTNVAECCAKSGFDWGFINAAKIVNLNCDPRFAVPRLSLPDTDNRYLIEAKLSGFEAALRRLLLR